MAGNPKLHQDLQKGLLTPEHPRAWERPMGISVRSHGFRWTRACHALTQGLTQGSLGNHRPIRLRYAILRNHHPIRKEPLSHFLERPVTLTDWSLFPVRVCSLTTATLPSGSSSPLTCSSPTDDVFLRSLPECFFPLQAVVTVFAG